MGYRSDVKIAMLKEDFDEMIARGEYTKHNYILDRDAMDYYKELDRGDNVVVVVCGWDGIKWYPEYTDISYVEDYLAEIEEKGKPYTFMRIGEDYEDIEIDRSWGESGCDESCDVIGIYREIEVYE